MLTFLKVSKVDYQILMVQTESVHYMTPTLQM